VSDEPQNIEGFTKIPHAMMEALIRSPLSSYEARAFLFIARMTWGWQGKGKENGDTIALRQFSDATGIERRNIFEVLKTLKDARLIVAHSNDRNAATYRINKNISEWRLSSIKATARQRRRERPEVRTAVTDLHDSLSRTDTTPLSCTSTHLVSRTYTPSEETPKDKEKERKESTALARGALLCPDRPIRDSDRTEEARKKKELSA
jgi:phage replication O-like protein O